MINFFLCEKGSKVLDPSIVRGEGIAPEANAGESRCFELQRNILLIRLSQPLGLGLGLGILATSVT